MSKLSKFSKSSKFTSLLFEDSFNLNYENLSSESTFNKTQTQIEHLLSAITNDKLEDKMIKDILNLISSVKLDAMNSDEFDEVSCKYLNKLNELYRDLMNRLKICTNQKESLQTVLINIESLNFSFSKFYKRFHESYQTYNEKHKNLMKIIPSGLKIYFKLFEDNFEILYANRPETLKSFLVNIISLINNFPLMIRTYENRLDNLFKNILTNFTVATNFDKEILNAVCLCYTLFIRLSPDINTRINLFFKKVISNFEFYMNLLIPKTVKSIKTKVNDSEKKKFDLDIFNFEESSSKQKILKNPTLQFSYKIMTILTKLLKYVFKSIPKNNSTEINFSEMINVFISNIKNYITSPFNFDKNDLVLEGLRISDYKIFKEIQLTQSLKVFKFFIKNYSDYFYFLIPTIKNTFSSIIIKLDDYTKLYDNYIQILKVFKLIIKNFDSNLHSVIDDFIYKICVRNMMDILVTYTERSDKTVVKIDNHYFKLKTLKTLNQKNKQSLSLIQMAKKEAFNENLEKYSNQEMEELLNEYLEIFILYFQSDCFIYLNSNEDNSALIRSLVNILLLPPYAKFIFSIPTTVKENLIKFVYNYLKYSNYMLSVDQLEKFNRFVRAFYSNDDIEKNYLIQIHDIINRRINLNSRHVSTDDINQMTMVTIDLNKRIADKLKVNAEFILNKIELDSRSASDSLLNKKRINDDATQINNVVKDTKSLLKLNTSEDNKESFKIELSLREDEKMNNSYNKSSKEQISLSKNRNLLDSKKPAADTLINLKWNLKDEKRSEFTSTDKIVMILKDKQKFINNNEKLTSLDKIDNDVEMMADPEPESNLFEEKGKIQPDSDSDSESQIDIPDIF